MFSLRTLAVASESLVQQCRGIQTTASLGMIQHRSRVRIVDNSTMGQQAMQEGRPPKVVRVYSKREYGITGDKILVACKGELKKAVLIGAVQDQTKPFRPKFDSNNAVLLQEDGSPLGSRIYTPIPLYIRGILREHSRRQKGAQYTKLLSIAGRHM